MTEDMPNVICSGCAISKPSSDFSRGQLKRRRRRCADCIVSAHQALQRPQETPADHGGDAPLMVSQQDVEQTLLAFKRGLISRSVYLAVVSAHEQQMQLQGQDLPSQESHNPQDSIRAAGAGNENNGLSRRVHRVRPLNWGYTRYLDRVFALRSFEDITAKRIFLDAKDIAESMASLIAVQRSGIVTTSQNCHDKNVWQWSPVVCLAVGDGCTPRTAGLAAYMTKWNCISVDPEMHVEWLGDCPKTISRLHCIRSTFESFFLGQNAHAAGVLTALIILCVHSHNRFSGEVSVDAVRASYGFPPTCLVAIPCCPEFNPTRDIGRQADVRYDDWAMFSQCRTVLVWKWPAGP